MWQGIAVCLSLLGAEDVTVKPLHGEAVRGSLVTLTEKNIVIHSATGEVKWDANGVQWLKPAAAGPSVSFEDKPTTVFVDLVDESVLVGERVTLGSGNSELSVPNATSLVIPNRAIRSMRFRKQDEELQKQWQAIAAANSSSDQLVIRKTRTDNAAPAAVVLDQLEGVVHSVSSTHVTFEYDGEKLNVALEKVEGIIFHQRQPGTLPSAACRVRDNRGGEWQVRTMQFAENRLTIETVAGVRGEIALDRVLEIDFTAGNMMYLSDLKPESLDWRPYLVTAATPPALAKWFSLRQDKAADGSVLMLGGRSFEKGLSIHSRTQVSYRLTKDFRHFHGIAGIDERFRGPANLQLTITGDDRTLLSRDVRGMDAPFEFDLDITGVRRLKILVDFGEDRSDAGDHLLMCEARLTK